MRYKRKLIVLGLVIALLAVIQITLPNSTDTVYFYDKYIFHPYQSFRNIVFSIIPISIGDILYVGGSILLLYSICKWIFYLIRYKQYHTKLKTSLLHTLIVCGILYIMFFLGWGGNYYKPSLSQYWGLEKKEWSKEALVKYDQYLIERLNAYAPNYQNASFKEIDKKAQKYYKEHTDNRAKLFGLNVKSSLFGQFMQYMGVQGYYNPFTGEAQVNKHLPDFMLPFVICHEMAHQAGIAAEDDANLLAYVLSTKVPDSLFNYSAYFNLWLYTHARLKAQDYELAANLQEELNDISLKHLDVLRDLRRKYSGDISMYSGQIYDGYLRMHQQRDGIESYNRVAITAWAWDENKQDKPGNVIMIP